MAIPIPPEVVDDIITFYGQDPQSLHQKYTLPQRLHLTRTIHHYLYDIAASLPSIPAAESAASELAKAIVSRARERSVSLTTIGQFIKAPYKGSLERYLGLAEKDEGGKREEREVMLEWGGCLEKGRFLESERVELAFLKSLGYFVRWAAVHSSPF